MMKVFAIICLNFILLVAGCTPNPGTGEYRDQKNDLYSTGADPGVETRGDTQQTAPAAAEEDHSSALHDRRGHDQIPEVHSAEPPSH